MSVKTAPIASEPDILLFSEQSVAARPGVQNNNIRKAFDESCGATGDFVDLLRHACPGIRLSDLPVEVAQLILDSQAKSIQEFFDSWAESIQEQAKLDKEASQRSQMNADALKRSQGFLLCALDRAVNLGQLSASEAGRIQGDDVVAMRLAAGQAVSELGATSPVAYATDAHSPLTLQEPDFSGVNLRAKEDGRS